MLRDRNQGHSVDKAVVGESHKRVVPSAAPIP
jgi:hypothetical protein